MHLIDITVIIYLDGKQNFFSSTTFSQCHFHIGRYIFRLKLITILYKAVVAAMVDMTMKEEQKTKIKTLSMVLVVRWISLEVHARKIMYTRLK